MIARLVARGQGGDEQLRGATTTRARSSRLEGFFWWYCDFYLELVKGRRYDSDPRPRASVSRALRLSLSVFQRLFAPFLPFVCEEVWSWWQPGLGAPRVVARRGRAAGGRGRRQAGAAGTVSVLEDVALEVTADVLREVRKAKSQARRTMRAPVVRVVVRDTAERLQRARAGVG